jgi:hypothetical protein
MLDSGCWTPDVGLRMLDYGRGEAGPRSCQNDRFTGGRHEQHDQLALRAQTSAAGRLSDRRCLWCRLVLGGRPPAVGVAAVDVDPQARRRRPGDPQDGRASGAPDPGISRRSQQGWPDAPGRGRHRHRAAQFRRHRTSGRLTAPAHPRPRGARHRHRRAGKQRALRRGLVQAGGALRGSRGDDPCPMGLQRCAADPRLAVPPAAQRDLCAASLPGQVARDLDRGARSPHDAHHRALRRRVVPGDDPGPTNTANNSAWCGRRRRTPDGTRWPSRPH